MQKPIKQEPVVHKKVNETEMVPAVTARQPMVTNLDQEQSMK